MRSATVLFFSLAGLFLTLPGDAATFIVDGSGNGDYTTIQEAVDAASEGDSILVQEGYYAESVRVPHDKGGLLIRGVPGPDFVTVEGDTATLAIWSTQVPVRVESLTLAGGSPYSAVYTQDARAEFVNCILTGNEGPGGCHGVGGGAQFTLSSDVLVENCVIEQNRSWESPGGLIIWQSRAEVRNNIFRQNQACYGGGLEMYHCADNEPSVIEGNLFVGNQVDVWGGGILNVDSSPVISRNTFVDNGGVDGAAVYVLGGSPEITHNIMVGSTFGVFCASQSGYPVSLPDIGANVVWDVSAATALCAAPDSMIQEDPRFCSAETGDYALCADSPAASGGFGAYGVGCDACPPVAVESTTWGRIKASFGSHR